MTGRKIKNIYILNFRKNKQTKSTKFTKPKLKYLTAVCSGQG